MNRCNVCDTTDEENPRAGITLVKDDNLCVQCREVIQTNLEDLSINDQEIAYDPEDLPAFEYDDHWIAAPLPEVSEQ